MLSDKGLYFPHTLMACWLFKGRNTVTSRVPLNIYNALNRKMICLNYEKCANYKNCVNYKDGCEFVSCPKVRTRIKIKENFLSTSSNIIDIKCSLDFKLSGECT
jgi:hypothetical protein